MLCDYYCFFFFKQKTAYEMRISDWSSDVCSSDLRYRAGRAARGRVRSQPPSRRAEHSPFATRRKAARSARDGRDRGILQGAVVRPGVRSGRATAQTGQDGPPARRGPTGVETGRSASQTQLRTPDGNADGRE